MYASLVNTQASGDVTGKLKSMLLFLKVWLTLLAVLLKRLEGFFEHNTEKNVLISLCWEILNP